MEKKIFVVLVIVVSLLMVIAASLLTEPTITPTHSVSGIQELVLNGQDLKQLGMADGGADCKIEDYQTSENSPMGQTNFCNYTVNSLDDTDVIVQLTKFANIEDLDGAYQYGSSHYYSIEGLLSENEFGDKSRFRVNNVKDYGGQYNDPNIYYYHLWICKDVYLIHITSKGSEKAREVIPKIGRQILSKFE